MKGYKPLRIDMSTVYEKATYKIGKKYTVAGKIDPYKNGFRFYKNLEDVEDYYVIKEPRIFEIEADGEIIEDFHNFWAESITLVRELSKEEVHQYFVDNQDRILKMSWYYRIALAKQGLCLDKLINDEEPGVREEVVRQGYKLDVLIKDESEFVRKVIADKGYGLDILVHDESAFVRTAVAKQGYGLDTLINDESKFVRMEIAKQEYGLETLVNDEDWCVRREVAERGYGLDVLINDTKSSVRATAMKKIEEKHPVMSFFHFMLPVMIKLESNKNNSKTISNSQ